MKIQESKVESKLAQSEFSADLTLELSVFADQVLKLERHTKHPEKRKTLSGFRRLSGFATSHAGWLFLTGTARRTDRASDAEPEPTRVHPESSLRCQSLSGCHRLPSFSTSSAGMLFTMRRQTRLTSSADRQDLVLGN
ncbi:unnamed protein product [Symbiodinium pilosum]|uniref:Uncharacterized protein n=1 Tax=Symbiodinium pilosum TaxID=2952 RepID=A0A812JTK2_SYMPI|nr:unnamed protein product [Symbiodinium pilosum]